MLTRIAEETIGSFLKEMATIVELVDKFSYKQEEFVTRTSGKIKYTCFLGPVLIKSSNMINLSVGECSPGVGTSTLN